MLACHSILINEVNWLGGDAAPDESGDAADDAHLNTPKEGRRVLARLRNTAPAMPARITGWPDAAGGVAEITLDEPQFGIAAGQAAALYDADDPDLLLGGGWIVAAPTGVAS